MVEVFETTPTDPPTQVRRTLVRLLALKVTDTVSVPVLPRAKFMGLGVAEMLKVLVGGWGGGDGGEPGGRMMLSPLQAARSSVNSNTTR